MIDLNDNAKAAVREFVEYIDEGDYLSVSLFPLLDNFLESRPTQPKNVADAVEWFMNGGWGSEWPYYDMDCITYGDSYFAFANSESISPNRYLVCTRFQFEGFGDTEGKQIKDDDVVGRSNITMEDINKHLDTGENPKGHVYSNNVEKILKSSYEQEGDKWTHVLWGDKAYIKISEPDCDGYLVVVTEGNGYNLVKMDDLKPIKPTLTKAEAWDMLIDFDESIHHFHDKYEAIKEQYDII